jgi:hypothetical protein
LVNFIDIDDIYGLWMTIQKFTFPLLVDYYQLKKIFVIILNISTFKITFDCLLIINLIYFKSTDGIAISLVYHNTF